MTITFEPLNESHFPLLLKWLMTPHVRKWWDKDIEWNEKLIEEKYSNYVKGYKLLNLQSGPTQKPIYAYVISVNNIPVGYIQYYDIKDFLFEFNYNISALPSNCAIFDWYIGEPSFLHRGIGSAALSLFIKKYIFNNFNAVLVICETDNIAAIKTYEKVGFTYHNIDDEIILMSKVKN